VNIPWQTHTPPQNPDATKAASGKGSDLPGPASELRCHADFPSRFLGNRRRLTVYLPPGYDIDHQRRYPVLYLHDGQNLFDAAAAAFGVAWDAHLTAERLIQDGRIPPLILVGIDNTPARIDEYTIHRDRRHQGGGRGRLYARFLAEEVKPFIDSRYRTLPDRQHTGVAGSSLGGLISLAIVREQGEHFGLCGVLSPSLWWGRGQMLRDVARDGDLLKRVRLWIDMGTREGHGRTAWEGVRRTRQLVRHLERAGLRHGEHFRYEEVHGGEHNEAAWGARFDRVLVYLFGG
jgi:predicted alpha/beta superfamily hydrolase